LLHEPEYWEANYTHIKAAAATLGCSYAQARVAYRELESAGLIELRRVPGGANQLWIPLGS
jgi:hypothetical protein